MAHKISEDPDLIEHVTDDHLWASPQPVGGRLDDVALTEIVAGLQKEIQTHRQEISDLKAPQREEGTLAASLHSNRAELEMAEEALRQAPEKYGSEIADLQRRCGQLMQDTVTYRLQIQAIESQQAQATHGDIISLQSELQGFSAKVQETERSLERTELSRVSLERRLTDSDARLSTSLQDLDRAREIISTLERRVVEEAEIAKRTELDRDSTGAGITSLRGQVQSQESAKGQEIRRFEQEIDGLGRQIEQHIAPKGKLLDEISGLEFVRCFLRPRKMLCSRKPRW